MQFGGFDDVTLDHMMLNHFGGGNTMNLLITIMHCVCLLCKHAINSANSNRATVLEEAQTSVRHWSISCKPQILLLQKNHFADRLNRFQILVNDGVSKTDISGI